VANHQANILGLATNTTAAIQYYHEKGQIPRNKLVVGIPLYGRSFLACAGPGTPFNGVGQGSWEAGVYDYRSLPPPGATVYYDREAIASYSFDPAKGEMISFDDGATARAKAEWIVRNGLGGAMYWEISGSSNVPPTCSWGVRLRLIIL
jgi:chitinase